MNTASNGANQAPSCPSSKPRRQCAKCPWKKGTYPYDIPNGYSRKKHAALRDTIADPGSMQGTGKMMACHETPPGKELVCVGWLANQLGPGNNLKLRLQVITGAVDARFELVGEQHETFEDTLPRKAARARKVRKVRKVSR